MDDRNQPPVILLLGPTASGKSALAARIAELLPVEIVSVDSAQIYRFMDIGTAKPGVDERAAVPHHLVDLINPDESYSVARFRDDAQHAVTSIHEKGRIPLLVGGTMLYFKALIEGLSGIPSADPGIRSDVDSEARAIGWPAMHRLLGTVDPETAARLPPNDAQRIGRALEVYRQTGVPMSRLLGERKGKPAWHFFQFALLPPDRAGLHESIARRFDAMLSAGLVDEVVDLRRRFALTGEMPSMRCVGYRQVWEMLEGRLPAPDLRDRGIYATRQLAKRQITWLRSWPGLEILDATRSDSADRVLAYLNKRISNA